MDQNYSNAAIKARNNLVKNPRWDKEKESYICQHCSGVVPVEKMAFGYDCKVCGLPIHER